MQQSNPTTYTAHNTDHEIEVEIGDAMHPEFQPQVKFKKWDNEVNLSVRYIAESNDHTFEKEGDKVKWIQDDQEVHIYAKSHQLNAEYRKIKTTHDHTTPVSLETGEFEHLRASNRIIGRDSERERAIRQEAAQSLTGDVLIVGLGLGILNEYLSHAKSVTVVEISKDVIDLVSEKYPERISNVRHMAYDAYRNKQHT
jgi:hypothetical protein